MKPNRCKLTVDLDGVIQVYSSVPEDICYELVNFYSGLAEVIGKTIRVTIE